MGGSRSRSNSQASAPVQIMYSAPPPATAPPSPALKTSKLPQFVTAVQDLRTSSLSGPSNDPFPSQSQSSCSRHYTVRISSTQTPLLDHLPSLNITPHGQPANILYSYHHTALNAENQLVKPSPQGDICVAKLFPPPRNPSEFSILSTLRDVCCEAPSHNLKWSIRKFSASSLDYSVSITSPGFLARSLLQISKPNPVASIWDMFYFTSHHTLLQRIKFGEIQANPTGFKDGGATISITDDSFEEKAVRQILGEGNEDCVEWVVLCTALSLLDEEILRASEKNPVCSESLNDSSLEPSESVSQTRTPPPGWTDDPEDLSEDYYWADEPDSIKDLMDKDYGLSGALPVWARNSDSGDIMFIFEASPANDKKRYYVWNGVEQSVFCFTEEKLESIRNQIQALGGKRGHLGKLNVAPVMVK